MIGTDITLILFLKHSRLLLPPGGTNPNPEAPTTTPLVSEPGCVTGNRTGPVDFFPREGKIRREKCYLGKIKLVHIYFHQNSPRFSLGSRLPDCCSTLDRKSPKSN